jgi:PhnB protein
MQAISTLYLQGQCDAALAFYRDAIGAVVMFHYTVADVAGSDTARAGTADRTLRAGLRIGETILYLSDGHGAAAGTPQGFSLVLQVAGRDEAGRVQSALAAGGSAGIPLGPTAWADVFGTVVDRFGVHWTIEAGHRFAVT